MWEYNATVDGVVDGDTLDLVVDLGFTVHVKVRARLYGVDTPETYGVKHDSEEYKAGKAATEFVEDWLAGFPGPDDEGGYLPITIRSYDGKPLGQGKYGRWLVEVMRPDASNLNILCLNDALVREGHAKEVTY